MKKAGLLVVILIFIVQLAFVPANAADSSTYKYLYPINVKDKWGYVDSKGKVIVKPQYRYANEFSEGMAAVCIAVKGQPKWGYIDGKGKVIIKPQYDYAQDFHEGLAAVKKGDYSAQLAFIDKKGKTAFTVKDSGGFIADTAGFNGGIAAIYQQMHVSSDVRHIDKKGNVISQEQVFDLWSETTQYRSGLKRVVTADGKTGYINTANKTVIQPQYDAAKDFFDGVAWVRGEDGWILINKEGKQLNSTKLQVLSNYSNGYARGQQSPWETGKWGYIDKEGNMVIPAVYSFAFDFSEGLAAVKLRGFMDFALGWSDGNVQYIDTSGNTVIAPSFNFAEKFKDGRADTYTDKHVFIDKTGKPVFEAFSPQSGFSEGYMPVRLNDNKYAYVDVEGRTAINGPFDEASGFSDGLARVAVNGKSGYIDTEGNFVVEPQYNEGRDFSEGRALVREGNSLYYIDKTGSRSIRISGVNIFNGYVNKYLYADSGFHEGLVAIEKDNKVGYMDNTGKVVITPRFDFAGMFSDGVAPVKKDGLYGFIDKTGQLVIEPQFTYVSNFKDGLAIIAKGSGSHTAVGFIDKNGKVVVSPQYEEAGLFNDGRAMVKIGLSYGKLGLVDKSGNLALAPQYDDLGAVSEGLVAFLKDDKWGYVDLHGKVAIGSKYDEAHEFKGGIAKVTLGGKACYIDKSGKLIWKQQ